MPRALERGAFEELRMDMIERLEQLHQGVDGKVAEMLRGVRSSVAVSEEHLLDLAGSVRSMGEHIAGMKGADVVATPAPAPAPEQAAPEIAAAEQAAAATQTPATDAAPGV